MQALRFEPSRALVSTRALAIFAAFCVSLAALPATAQTIDRVKAAGRINLGYIPDALPFTVRTAAGGAPEGYSVELCKQIVDRLKTRCRRRNSRCSGCRSPPTTACVKCSRAGSTCFARRPA